MIIIVVVIVTTAFVIFPVQIMNQSIKNVYMYSLNK